MPEEGKVNGLSDEVPANVNGSNGDAMLKSELSSGILTEYAGDDTISEGLNSHQKTDVTTDVLESNGRSSPDFPGSDRNECESPGPPQQRRGSTITPDITEQEEAPDELENELRDTIQELTSLQNNGISDSTISDSDKSPHESKARSRPQGSSRSNMTEDGRVFTPRPYSATASGDTAPVSATPRRHGTAGEEADLAGDLPQSAQRDPTMLREAKQRQSMAHMTKQAQSAISIHAAAQYGEVEHLKHHLEVKNLGPYCMDTMKFTPLHFAACYGQDKALELLLEHGKILDPVSKQGWTPLHLASRNGQVDCVQRLLNAGASATLTDKKQANALHNACCGGNLEVIDRILKENVEIDAQDNDGWGAIHFAARFNHSDMLDKLLAAGANPDLQDVDGWTAVHNSARNGRNKCVQLLLQHKANVGCQTRYGETALHIACRKGKAKVVGIIVEMAEQQGLLRDLLMTKDHEGFTPEDVPSSDFIRSILRKDRQSGSIYDMSDTLAVRTESQARKTRFCSIM